MIIFLAIVILVGLAVAGFAWKPSRKAFGLATVVAGAILSLTFVGALIGVPAMIVGGIMLFA